MNGQAATTSEEPDILMLVPTEDGMNHITEYLRKYVPQDPKRDGGRVSPDTMRTD
jgi:hypothetical protein